MPDQQYSIWGLIKYLIGLFFSSQKQKQEKDENDFKKSQENLKNRYNEIDAKKDEQKNKDLNNRLDNMF